MLENVGNFLAKRALLNPGRIALIETESDTHYSYKELNDRANRCCHLLADLGVRAGDRISLLANNSVEFVEIYFAAAKLGAVLVPLNWRLVAGELVFMLKDAGVTCFVHGSEFDALVLDVRERLLESGEVDEDWCWVRIDRRGAGEPPDDFLDYASRLAAHCASEPDVANEGDHPLFIMYTSGTTGLPKGAVHTHGTMIAASTTMNMTGDYRIDDRMLQMLPLFHVGALSPLTCSIHRGSTNVVMEGFDPDKFFKTIERYRVTTGFVVPGILEMMLDHPDIECCDLSSLNWVMCGAAPVASDMIRRYAERGVEIFQAYGLTESAGPGCLISPEYALEKAGSTGHAFFHTDVRIVDENGSDVDPDEVGELIIRGKHVMKEYWRRADATREAIRDGWLYTGDLASLDEDGFIYIRDRKKDMIISGGENVYPAEIEAVIAAHEAVQEVAVIGVPSERWGESPMAIVVVRDGVEVDAGTIGDHCRDKLARYKQPRLVQFVDDIPKTPTGKVLKRELRQTFPGPAPE
jgi:O-succinylbenzoate-CoA ligase